MVTEMPVETISVTDSISVKEAAEKIRDFLSEDSSIDLTEIAVCQAIKGSGDDIKNLVSFFPNQVSALETMGRNGPKLFESLQGYLCEAYMAYGQFTFRPDTIYRLIDDIEAATPRGSLNLIL